jgi:hypothetical protein
VPTDHRHLRLYDVGHHESVAIRCKCGRTVEYPYGLLQRRFRLRSDTLIYDLQFRFRCKQCNLRDGFTIAVVDRSASPRPGESYPERIVVAPEW